MTTPRFCERRYLALWLPRFPIELWERQDPSLRSRPFALTARLDGGIRLAAVNGMAAERGIAPGFSLTDARAIEPGIVIRDADPARDARALAALADWCTRFTPVVAIADADTLMLDITGCAHLWGGERGLLRDLLERLAGFGHDGRASIAPTPGAAWALARFDGRNGRIVAAGHPASLEQALAPLPVQALRLDPATASALDRVGLRRIGDLARLPAVPLARRFGETVVHRLRQARGEAPEPLTPYRPVPPHRVRAVFAEPLWRPEDVADATRRLLDRLCEDLRQRREGARRVTLDLIHVDGRADRLEIGTAAPSRRPDALMRLLAPRLGGADPGNGIEVMVLAAPVAEPLATAQAGLLSAADGTATEPEKLTDLVDRLDNRIGRVVRPEPTTSRIPERAVVLRPPFARTVGAAPSCWPLIVPRPHRLMIRPERIETVAEVPDGPPVMFLWRGTAYRVRVADGPERLSPEWWDAADDGRAPRDYYRIEDVAGRRFWVFRHGLFETGSRVPDWYLHGFFA
jgi:protein ImuB